MVITIFYTMRIIHGLCVWPVLVIGDLDLPIKVFLMSSVIATKEARGLSLKVYKSSTIPSGKNVSFHLHYGGNLVEMKCSVIRT